MLQREHSAILLTCIKLPFVIKIFVLSIFEWPFYTGFTVPHGCMGLKEKSLPRVTVWQYETCQVMTNGDSEEQIFSIFVSYP